MDTGLNDAPNNENPDLEAEYLGLFGASVARCVEELLVISYRTLIHSSTKENGPNDPMEFVRQLKIAIQQSGLESRVSPPKSILCFSISISLTHLYEIDLYVIKQGVGCLPRMKDGAERIELVNLLAKQIAQTAGYH